MFRLHYGNHYTPEQTVFVDESSFDRRTGIRGRAWALSGQRAIRKCFLFVGEGVLSVITCCVLKHREKVLPTASTIFRWDYMGEGCRGLFYKTTFSKLYPGASDTNATISW
jgi:hypothetical protein